MGFDGAGDGPLIAPFGIHHADVLAPPFVLAAQDVDAGRPYQSRRCVHRRDVLKLRAAPTSMKAATGPGRVSLVETSMTGYSLATLEGQGRETVRTHSLPPRPS